jgi:hypothetical protein
MEIKIEIKPIEIHEGRIVYKCGGCGATGVRLWRRWNTFVSHQSLTCKLCSELDQSAAMMRGHDQIGSRIPAVPTEENDTFWGYSSVPDDAVQWWLGMPEDRSTERILYDFIIENSSFSRMEICRMVGRSEYKKIFVDSRGSEFRPSPLSAIYESAGMTAVMMEDMKHRDEDKYTYRVTLASCDSNGRLSAQRSKHVRFLSEPPEGAAEEQHEGPTSIRL